MRGATKNSSAYAGTAKRIIIYGILTLVLGCAQCAFFPTLSLCPATPDLIMGMLLAIAILDSPKSAAVCALGAGFFVDAVGGSGVALSPLVYLIYVLMISVFAGKVLKSFFSYTLLLIPTLIYRAVATYLCFSVHIKALAPLWSLKEIILPEAVCTAILCLPIYFIVKLCAKPIDTHGRFTF